MAYRTTGGQNYTLVSSISSTATTIRLSSFTEPVSGTPYTMAIIGSSIVYATIAPKTTQSEFISFTGITQNADGTADLTGVTRGLGRSYPYASSSTYKLPHPGQSILILSDAPQVFNSYGALANDEVIEGQWEAPDPITAQGIVTRDWILALINGGAISTDAQVIEGTAGTTIAEGDLIYFSETDNEWLLCDADTATTIQNVKLGIAQGAGTNGVTITGGILTLGLDETQSGLTQGDLIYASNTAGGVNSGTPGTVPRVVGIAISATQMYFDPYFQNTLYDYAVDSVGTDSYAVTLAGAFSAYYPGMTVKFKAGTANTGACTLAVNGLTAKSIYKNANTELVTGDILQNQIVVVVYDGSAFQIISNIPSPLTPTINIYTANAQKGGSNTQFDITEITPGVTYRYTYDGTGTDPLISSATMPIGTVVNIQAQNFSAVNNGLFTVTGSGSNYFEVTNASGVAESNKTLGTGILTLGGTYTKPSGLKYIVVELVGGGSGGGACSIGDSKSGSSAGGGAGGYSKKTINASSLAATVSYNVGTVGDVGTAGSVGGRSIFNHSTPIIGLGGTTGGTDASPIGGAGGSSSGGDINITGQYGNDGGGESVASNNRHMGAGTGGSSMLGIGGAAPKVGDYNGRAGTGYGAGGSGACASANTSTVGGVGTSGVIIITEYF